MSQLRIKFCMEEGGEIEAFAQAGEKLNQVAARVKVTIQQTCGGVPSCTDCRVKVLEGVDELFEPMEYKEKSLLGNVYHITHERLACQARIQGSGCVWVPKRIKRKKG